jgi:Dual-action HEIGH metallo-peptidase
MKVQPKENRPMNIKRVMVFVASCGALTFGCGPEGEGAGQEEGAAPAAEGDEATQEILANLAKAGFPDDDVMVVDGLVYVGRDAVVSLEASREMLQVDPAASGQEQYRTKNLVKSDIRTICVIGQTFTGLFSQGLDLAIQNYNQQNLSFRMERRTIITTGGCDAIIAGAISGPTGGSSGFPSGGLPFGSFKVGSGTASSGLNVVEHVITHELGHAVGFRHSDFFNRSISCGTGGDEGSGSIGAILIPGTPSNAVRNGSLMNSCFNSGSTGEFTSSDITALRALYSLFSWSSAGPLAGQFCTHVNEPSDPHAWADNYLCSKVNFGIKWSNKGPIGGMRCTQIFEQAEPTAHAWFDNYLCVPNSSPLQLAWSQAGPIAGKGCVQVHEAADPHAWADNYLCY